MKCSCGAEIYPDQPECPVCGTRLEPGSKEPAPTQRSTGAEANAPLEAGTPTEELVPGGTAADSEDAAPNDGSVPAVETAPDAAGTSAEGQTPGDGLTGQQKAESQEASVEGAEAVSEESATATEQRESAEVTPAGQDEAPGDAERADLGYRQCVHCGYLLGPEDPACPVCRLRGEAGTTLVVAGRPPLRGPALPTVSRRAGLLGLALVAVVALGALTATSYESLGFGQTKAVPQQGVTAPAAPVLTPRPISAQLASGSPTASPTPTIRPTATHTPAPTATPSRAETRATAMAASVLALPTAGPDPAQLGSGWIGFMTVTSITQPEASAAAKERLSKMMRNARMLATSISIDFQDRDGGIGSVKFEELDATGDWVKLSETEVTAWVRLMKKTADFVYRNGKVSIGGDEPELYEVRFEGTLRRTEARYVMEGTWVEYMPATLEPAGEGPEMWEGTWTVTKPR